MEKKSVLQEAVEVVRAGGVIAYPTEGVYGLGCDPHNESALQRIIDIKGRSSHKGFILIASKQDQLSEFIAPVQDSWQKQFDSVWPGPVTFIVPAARGISSLLSGFRDTVAVRVSDHPIVCNLCQLYGNALVSTSANRSGSEALKSAADVKIEFSDVIDIVVDGELGELATSTSIIDVISGHRLR